MKFLWLALAALLTATCTEAQKTFEVLEGPNQDLRYWGDRCKLQGGRLASITSEEEQAAVQAALKGTGKHYVLTGMKRVRPHEQFVTVDGEPLSYTNWITNQPDDHNTGEECLEVHVHGNNFGKWNDITCRRDAALCEFEPVEKSFEVLDSSSRKTLAEWNRLCKKRGGRLASALNPAERHSAAMELKGWIGGQKPCGDMAHMFNARVSKGVACNGRVALCEFAPKTYSLVKEHGRALSFEQWRAKCQARGAQLGRINNAEEQRKAFRLIKTSQQGSVLIDSKRKYRGSPIFQNSDGKTIPYSNWNNGEPNNYGGHQSCTHVITRGPAAGRWDDIGCNKVTAALCESRKFTRNVRYVVLKDNRDLTYSKWVRRCEAKGGHLATIRNGGEQALAEKALRSTRRSYILTGMKRKFAHSKTFVDVYGHVVKYGNWIPRQPDDFHGEDCIELHNTGNNFGKWNDIKCKRNAALCEIN